jgi:DNA-directed RNA polymerase specialized sigma24 family protein
MIPHSDTNVPAMRRTSLGGTLATNRVVCYHIFAYAFMRRGRRVEITRRDHARTLWQQLALRNQWQLVVDEDAFLDDVLAEDAELSIGADLAGRLRIAVQRAYSLLLYRGLTNRDERAAYEMWLMFMRLALRSGVTSTEVDDLAQESVARVLAKLTALHTPQSLLSWAMMLFRTVQRDLRLKRQESSLTTETGDLIHDPADPSDLVIEVESRLAEQEFRDKLRDPVPNDLERLTLIRCVIFDDDPRDVARDLGLPLYRTRVAKSRALQRLRTNPAFMSFIYSLGVTEPQADRVIGVHHNE